MKILCVGEMLIDFTPVPNLAGTYTANPGGAPANVAVGLARNGVKAGFLGKLGNDDFGRLLLKTLKSEGVEVLLEELTDEAITTMTFVTFDENRERSFTFVRKPGADMLLNEDEVEKVDFDSWDIVHAGSVSQSESPSREAVLLAMKKAKEAGKLVSFDINYRDKIWGIEECREEFRKVLEYVDFLKISEEELIFVEGEENIPVFMEKNNISVVVLTRGGEGATIYYGQEKARVDAIMAKVVDTTGAGDAYWGGFLSELTRQEVHSVSDITMDMLQAAGRYGAVAGSMCVEKPGGIPALPYREDILRVCSDEKS